MIYQCTKEVLKTLKVDKMAKPDIYNDLLAWHVKLMKINRRNLVYLMNDATKLSVILYGFTAKDFKDFDFYAKKGIENILEDCGIPNAIIHRYLGQIGDAIYTSSGTRKQIGVLNRAAMEVQYFWNDLAEDSILQRGLCAHQNKSMMKNDNGDYVTPKIIARNLLENTFGEKAVTFDIMEIASHMFSDNSMDYVSFLNIRDGSICLEERNTEKFEIMQDDDDYIIVRGEHLDFFHHFRKFARNIDHAKFHQDLERDGHGNGAIRRIKDLLYNYPDIQMKWYAYKDNVEQDCVKRWLESVGLM